MKHYIELTLIANTDVNAFNLWSKLYQQLHLGFVEIQDAQERVPIGISFPEYVVGEKYSVLGGKCRLFAHDEATLTRFDVNKWLARLSDYMHCTSIRPVPDKISGYAIYQRQQPKTSPARLARRYAKRHNMDFETALHDTINLADKATPNTTYQQTFRYCDMPSKAISTPFIRLKSLSSGQDFCLWIKKSAASEPVVANFSSYGLSASATVPEF